MENVQLSDGEIAELNEAVTRSHSRSNELRAQLASLPPASGTGEFLTRMVGREADTDPPDEELVRAARSGDWRVRETLFERHTPMIVSEARSFRVDRLDFADLIQEGYIGLLRAIGQFDPDEQRSFAPVARVWIRHSLEELQADFLRPLRLPREALRDLSRLKTERDRIFMTEHHEPSLRELAERTGIDYERAQELVRADRRPRRRSWRHGSGSTGAGRSGVSTSPSVSGSACTRCAGSSGGRWRSWRGPLRCRGPTSTEEA